MAKFTYVYQKVVDFKTSEKSHAESVLSAAVGKLQAEERSLSELLKDRNMWMERLQEAASSTVSLAELLNMQRYVDYIDAQIANKQNDIRKAQREVELKRSLLTDKMQDEKVWLKAKDKAFDQYRAVLMLQEQNELDEIATVRYVAPAAR
ncbi:flagellar FliJ protein [Paenibacillus phyllosphaerae]|uniref:Flagellar FliJ protein n=1 Tax=Paenibacillus phyllosphaerae TaxID=274593 RepID=A0A7W5FLU3_9BACL|nr:flagellar export protein FliJ [Paenibacillus phyllosphaerae]MBB3109392.1 flagellar FliJ protein [Paenibacillus phyllosphaerae]